MIREHYRWILFPKAAINGGAKSGLSTRGQHQLGMLCPISAPRLHQRLSARRRLVQLFEKMSERSIEIWGMVDSLRGLAS